MPDEEIERRVLEIVGDRQLKVAFVIAKFSDIADGDEAFLFRVEAAIRRLVSRDALEGFGYLSNWRHSEIKRTP